MADDFFSPIAAPSDLAVLQSFWGFRRPKVPRRRMR